MRPSAALRRPLELLHGHGRRLGGPRALDDTAAIMGLAGLIDRSLAATAPGSTLDLRAMAASILATLAANQRQGSPAPASPERVWGQVLRGETVAPEGLRRHVGVRAVAAAAQNEGAVQALADLLDRGLTVTTRGTGTVDPQALAAWLLREIRG